MGAFYETIIENDDSSSLAPKLQQLHGSSVTKRIKELEDIVADLRSALEKAEEELEREKARVPMMGDFVRCPLTNFFGKVTKVIPRPHGRPWVEITPYLAKDLPGHGTLDLYDSWELIDPPTEPDEAKPLAMTPVRLPSVSSFELSFKPPSDEQQLAEEIQLLLGELWADPDRKKGPA